MTYVVQECSKFGNPYGEIKRTVMILYWYFYTYFQYVGE